MQWRRADISPYSVRNAAIFMYPLYLICSHRTLPYHLVQIMPRELTVARSRSQVSQDKGKSSASAVCVRAAATATASVPAHFHARLPPQVTRSSLGRM